MVKGPNAWSSTPRCINNSWTMSGCELLIMHRASGCARAHCGEREDDEGKNTLEKTGKLDLPARLWPMKLNAMTLAIGDRMCMEPDRALRARDFVNQFSEHNAKTVRECVTKYPAILAQEDFCACMGEQMVQKYRDSTGPPTSSAPTSRASRSRTRSRTGPTQCSSSGSTQRCTMSKVRPEAGRAQKNACRLCRNRGEPAVPRGIGAALADGRVARSCRNL